MTYETWSPSTNSATLLYAAAVNGGEHPKGWNAAVEIEADNAGISQDNVVARSAYFQKRFNEVVAADPWKFVHRVRVSFGDFFWYFDLEKVWEKVWVIGAIGVVAIGNAFVRRSAWWLLLLPFTWGFVKFGPPLHLAPVSLGIWLLALALAREKRAAFFLLGALVIGAGLLNALVANFGVERGAIIIFWAGHLLVIAPVLLLAGGQSLAREINGSDRVYVRPLAWGTALGFVLGFTLIAFRIFSLEDPAPLRPGLSAEAYEFAKSGGSEWPVDAPREFFATDVKLTGYQNVFGPHEDGGHWSRAFEARDYERVIFFPRIIDGPDARELVDVCVAVPVKGFPERGRFLLTGVENTVEKAPLDDAKTVIEVTSLVPLDRKTGKPVFDNAILFDLSPEAKAVLENAGGNPATEK